MKNVGELRAKLADIMTEVSSGKLTVERANAAVKAAGQINESIYAELKAKALAKRLDETVYPSGKMPLD